MRCALCDHRATFPEVGRTRGDNRRLFRCPRCKLDQAKNLFGTGQYVDHRRGLLEQGLGLDLDVPPETSPIKYHYESELVRSGLLPGDQLTPLSEEAGHDFLANVAQEQGHHGIADALREAREPASTSDHEILPHGVARWDRLTSEQQAQHRKRVVDALDDVVDETMASLQLNPSDMSEPLTQFFIQFSRLMLKDALSAYEIVRECGANEHEMPFGQILAGFRPAFDAALEMANQARSEVPPESRPAVKEDPFIQLISAFTVPVQEAIDARLSDDIFNAIQHRTWLDPSTG